MAHAKLILGAELEDGAEERPDGKGGWETWLDGKPYCGFELGDGCVWARLLAPRHQALSPKVTWERDRREGWVRTALPPTYKPEPWLAADIGGTVGQTRWEMRHGTEQTITAQLGPYVVVPAHLVGTWDPKTRLGGVDNLASIVDLPHGQIVVMGKLGALTWHPDEHGGVLARVFAGKVEAPQVRAMLAGAGGWKSVGTLDVTQTQLWAFDGATPGAKISALQAVRLGLSPGRYTVSTATHASDKATLLLVRLRR